MSDTKKCPCCDGSGIEQDNIMLGRELRLERMSCGITLRQMATMISVSPAFLSQLENGRRSWKRSVRKRYEQILKQ